MLAKSGADDRREEGWKDVGAARGSLAAGAAPLSSWRGTVSALLGWTNYPYRIRPSRSFVVQG